MPNDVRVAELLVKAGGKPAAARQPGPRPTSSTPGWATPARWPSGCTRIPPTPPDHGVPGDPGDFDGKTPAVSATRATARSMLPRRCAGRRHGPADAVAAACKACRAGSACCWGRRRLVAVALVVALLLPRGDKAGPPAPVVSAPPKAPAPPPVDFRAAISAGGLDVLQDARAEGQAAAGQPRR